MATLHFITGKGGVGRSTVAAALTRKLAEANEGPILLLEVQGSGRSLQLCGLEGPKPFNNTSLPALRNAWGARILPKESFRQYFSLLLALGNDQSSFANVTSNLRERLVDIVADNKIVSSFIDVCPGLEPSVLLGKLHWESTQGNAPQTSTPWKHVVVDGPATGHSLMLFKSTNALTEVFGAGVILKQASEIMSFIRNPQQTSVYIVSTPDELPLRETLDLRNGLANLKITVKGYLLNRAQPQPKPSGSVIFTSEEWKRETEFEHENASEQSRLTQEFRTQIDPKSFVQTLPEIYVDEPLEIARQLARELP